MRHVQPRQWADAERGRLTEKRVARMARHAAQCQRCAGERDRVLAALNTFQDIRDTEAPALRWEQIGARIYWMTSSERRWMTSSERQADAAPKHVTEHAAPKHAAEHVAPEHVAWGWRRLALPVGLVVAAAALVVVLYNSRQTTDPRPTVAQADTAAPATQHTTGPVTQETAAPVTALATSTGIEPRALSGLMTFLEGDVAYNGTAPTFDREILVNDHLETADGSVAVQFGQHNSFTLGAHSTLELVAFDDRRVELSLRGEIVIDIAARSAEQTFVVRAGQHRVMVHGTTFRVLHRDGALHVACTDGRVAVSAAAAGTRLADAAEVSVAAGHVLRWLEEPTVHALTEAERVAIERRIIRVPAWAEPEVLRQTTSALRVTATEDQPVHVDGQWVGTGSFALRVMPGRHFVGRPDGAGSWRELDAGAELVADLVADLAAEPVADLAAGPVADPVAELAPKMARNESDDVGRNAREAARDRRRAQLIDAIGQRTTLRGCVAALHKQSLLDGMYIEFDIGIHANGTISHLNIADTNLPPTSAACVRDVVDRVDFPRGAAANLNHRIAW